MYGDDTETFEEYKRKINLRADLDAEMKQVMISTRREFLFSNIPDFDELVEFEEVDDFNEHNSSSNPSSGSNPSNNSVDRASNLVNLVNKINQIIGINKIVGNKLKNKLTDYISCKIELIILDVETFIEYEDIIKKIESELDPNTLDSMSKIIIPDSIQLLDEYKQVFKQSKIDWETDQERIQEQKEQKEQRIKITQSLMLKIIKISNYDTEAKELELILSPLFDQYNNLITNSVNIEQSILDKIVRFISKSRFAEQEKKDILDIFI